MPNSHPPPRAERRPSRRKRVFMSGKIAYADGAYSFNCAIHDLNENGARISVPPSQPIPSKVFLIILATRTVHEARVVWNNGRQQGLQLLNTSSLDKIADPALRYLKRLAG
jgi:PilZ domain